MSIRRLQYQIDFLHIITFREEYKKVVSPFFGFNNMEYGIENENTIHENIRLIFKNEQFALFLRKEAIAFLFEGDIEELRNPNGVIKLFWDLYESVKKFSGYIKSIRHHLIVHAVKIKDKEEIDEILRNNTFINLNPFGKLEEFGCNYEFTNDNKNYKFHFGNFSDREIKIHDLSPFRAKFNEDLFNNVGMMGKLEAIEEQINPSFGKYKSLLLDCEKKIAPFNL